MTSTHFPKHYPVSLALQLLFACIATIAFANSASAENWTRFRGPNGSGISKETVPTKWGESENIKWKLDLPGPGTSSPIIVGDKVFLTSYSGYIKNTDSMKELARHLICIDRKTGKQLWDKESVATNPEDPAQGFINDHGYASSTPVSDGERVYVFYGKSGALAYDLDGNKLWQTPLGTESSPMRWGSGTSPILYEDLVIIVAADESRTVYGLDKKTGEKRWEAPAESLEQCFSTPILVEADGKTSLVLSVPHEVWGLNPKTGKMMWYANTTTTNNATPSVVANDGIVYVTGGRGGGTIALRASGKGDITESNVVWSAPVVSYVPSPVYYDNKLYWVSEQGIVTCLNAKDGKTIYRERLSANNTNSNESSNPGGRGGRGPAAGAPGAGGGPAGPGGSGAQPGPGGGNRGGGGGGGMGRSFYASVSVIGDKMYAVSRNSGTFVFESGDKFKLISQNKLDDSVTNASPAVADGELYLRSNKAIYCISEKK